MGRRNLSRIRQGLLLQKDQAAADALRDGVGAAGGVEFRENRADVELHGVFGDGEPPGDLFAIRMRRMGAAKHQKKEQVGTGRTGR